MKPVSSVLGCARLRRHLPESICPVQALRPPKEGLAVGRRDTQWCCRQVRPGTGDEAHMTGKRTWREECRSRVRSKTGIGTTVTSKPGFGQIEPTGVVPNALMSDRRPQQQLNPLCQAKPPEPNVRSAARICGSWFVALKRLVPPTESPRAYWRTDFFRRPLSPLACLSHRRPPPGRLAALSEMETAGTATIAHTSCARRSA